MQIKGVAAPAVASSRPASAGRGTTDAAEAGDSVRISKRTGCSCGDPCTCGASLRGLGPSGCGCQGGCQCGVEAAARATREGSHVTSATAACSLVAGPGAGLVGVVSAAAPQPVDLTARLKAMLPPHPFVISVEKVNELQQALGLDRAALLQALVPVAREYARPPISNYQVGAAGLGKSGQIYLGVNLEFGGNALNQTVHGEQFTVMNALRNGEERLEMLAVSAAPCGHCRQWLNEVTGGSDLLILTPNSPPTPLKELLPASFGPGDLGVSAALLTPQSNPLRDTDAGAQVDGVASAARQAAEQSYAPYSHSPSGVAVQLRDGSIVSGRYAENAAFNPSLSPLQGALVQMVAEGRRYDEIERAVLVEKKGAPASQQAATRALLESIQPAARVEVHLAE